MKVKIHPLQYLRAKAGLKQCEVAARLKVSPTSVSSWERGIQIPDQHWVPLAKLFGITLDEFLTRMEYVVSK